MIAAGSGNGAPSTGRDVRNLANLSQTASTTVRVTRTFVFPRR